MFTAHSTKFLWKPRVLSKRPKFALHSHQNRTALPKAFSLAWFSRQIRYRNPWNFCLWNLEAQKILLLECGILGFGIRNTAQRIRNPSNDWNPESNFYWQRLEDTGIWNHLKVSIQNPNDLNLQVQTWNQLNNACHNIQNIDNNYVNKLIKRVLNFKNLSTQMTPIFITI